MKKLTQDEVLRVATEQINANGSTTTLDVKRQLQKEDFGAFQWEVSKFMQDLFGAGKLASTNDSSLPYQTYDLPHVTRGGTVSTPPASSGLDLKGAAKRIMDTMLDARFAQLGKLTRQDIIGQGFSAAETDYAIQSLIKKDLIIRIGTGEYTLSTTVTGAKSSSAPSLDPLNPLKTIALMEQYIEEKEQSIVEKDQKIRDLQKKLETSTKLIEAAHSELIASN